MTAYATFNPTSLLVSGDAHSRPVTILSGQNLKRGAVVGRITASDKYTLCVAGASDGSQVPAAVVAGDVDASSADTTAPAYFEAEVIGEQLVLDASWTLDTLDAAFRVAGSQIYVRKAGALG